MYPERGAIIYIDLNPVEGREQGNTSGKPRPCLVLSSTEWNRQREGKGW